MRIRYAILVALLAGCTSDRYSVRCTGDVRAPVADCSPTQPMGDPGEPIWIDADGQRWAASCDDGQIACDAAGEPTAYRFAQVRCMGYTPSCDNGTAPRCRRVACSGADAGP